VNSFLRNSDDVIFSTLARTLMVKKSSCKNIVFFSRFQKQLQSDEVTITDINRHTDRVKRKLL